MRRRLPRDVLWLASLFMVYLAGVFLVQFGVGIDSHAYWAAWRGEMYGAAPATSDAYLYSPAFAQLIWPLAQLPSPVFASLWAALIVGSLVWLVKVSDWYVAVPLLLVGSHEVISGNINWLLALVAVIGLRHPSAWALPFFTKITPCLGPLWFLVRREWRNLAVSLAAIAAIATASWALSPELWHEWLAFLTTNFDTAGSRVGGTILPPLALRLPVVLVMVAWGARTNRVWVLPVGMLLASPVAGPGMFVILLALPRLNRPEHHRSGRGQTILTAVRRR